MGILSPVFRVAGSLMFDRPAKKKTYDQIIADLESNQADVLDRLAKAEENQKNHALITHIIGIERWSQTRLRTLLGDPPGEQEYDPYRPLKSTSWSELPQLFEDTRQETIQIARELAENDIQTQTAPHNMFGDMTPRGWLVYLDGHAAVESKRLR